VELLIMLGPAPPFIANEDQSLPNHIGLVLNQAGRIATALGLSGAVRHALLFAAQWHDEGKMDDIWQFFAYGRMKDGQFKGKTSQARHPSVLKGYRHEFGSILRLQYPDRCEKIDCTLPGDEEERELALHLIATHHGAGRPHFGQANYDPFTDAERDTAHIDAIRRFARLQRKYGWWHLAWLENLLRCADQLASADEEVTSIDELEGVAT
jgi:CRISPR-associated endonuclease/helicase Cas3